ncbi:MAG: peptidoglycan DD-metalloendopeptidase family protein [Deltaproteobacteria bacterium]|nr:peptidoglycan DD-metalloendopeptidase family protein [Deltaproteobacteria bacterium]MBI3293407.1 peptidoglycan DD-metalloendopeptidase family protein [Deltaproteobacteria bacterium]
MIRLILILPIASAVLWATPNNRAAELRELIQNERPRFEQREIAKHDLLEELDTINSDQNKVREKIAEIRSSHRELTMARDNLTMEFQKQASAQNTERARLGALARFIYKIKKDGFLRFVANGENLGQLAGRIRILYRTFRSHAQLTQKLDERAARLKKSEAQITTVQEELGKLLNELSNQEQLLQGYLERKRQTVALINRKQNIYQKAVREYRQVSSDLSQMFSTFPVTPKNATHPVRHSLPLPVPMGHITKGFGKSVHEQFGTVIFHKGLEIEAEHNTPVSAVFKGTVEFAGWLKGLGKVLIISHGAGIYSLCAHLFKTVKEKGATVEQGETIGYVGDTGSAERASLYFEIRENNRAVDPMAYFSSATLRSLL